MGKIPFAVFVALHTYRRSDNAEKYLPPASGWARLIVAICVRDFLLMIHSVTSVAWKKTDYPKCDDSGVYEDVGKVTANFV